MGFMPFALHLEIIKLGYVILLDRACAVHSSVATFEQHVGGYSRLVAHWLKGFPS
jgi:hypothetical protein